MSSRTLLWSALAVLAVSALLAAGCCPLLPTGGTTQEKPPAPAPQPAETKPAETTAPSGSGAFKVGDSVAAIWSDGNLYLATVTNASGDQVTVKYADDSSEKTVSAADVIPIEVREWAVGDKVRAVWSSGRFYEGTISAAADPSYTVKWDDGSAPSEVTSDRIIAAE
ncbi:MAG: hypothetical protein FDZ70_08695 [Actinobacteria bacterium]|nr:MAG: hypothetical protein FDZ70_08695 [Actinomycetota bacterium]